MTTPSSTTSSTLAIVTKQPIDASRSAKKSGGLLSLGLLVIILGGVGVTFGPKWLKSLNPPASAAVADEKKPSHDLKTTVLLPEGKFKTANIQLGTVGKDNIPTEVVLTGQVSLNHDRQVEVKPRVPGVVRSVAVSIGKKVKAGDLLVTLDSVDIGTARLNLRARQRELATEKIDAEWKHEVNVNVEAMVPLLRKGAPARQIEDSFRGKLLGTFRGDLLGSYADFEIASHEEEKQADLNKQGLVGEHPVFVTKHTREGKQAKFEATLEQVRFDAAQQARLAEQRVRAAEAAVIDAAQRLRMLGVKETMASIFDTPPASKSSDGQFEDVTIYPITAPFDGTIVVRSSVPSQRVEVTDGLFTLADLTTVRVTANVPESRVSFLPALGKPSLLVTAPAYPGKTFNASLIYVGEQVDPATRTVSLIAEMQNPDGQLRPGMFAQIQLDSHEKTTATTVPAGAVVEIEGKTGVFQPGTDANMFTFIPVTAGPEARGRRVIVSGINLGDKVVISGAFTLKSELVLQNESEEE
jgi:RND family efflux transporter MFP subunit